MRTFFLALFPVVLGLHVGCASAPVLYDPVRSATAKPDLTPIEAALLFEESFKKTTIKGYAEAVDFKFGRDQLSFVVKWYAGKHDPLTCRVVYGTPLLLRGTGTYAYIDYGGNCYSTWVRSEVGDLPIRTMDALFVLVKFLQTDHTSEYAAQLKQFETVAQAYRAEKKHSPISEEVRRNQVQAENAFDQKRYGEAARHYSQGLELLPTWADGHYNLALLYGQIGFHALAILEMKKYLLLMPDAKDARSARDQIYTWEGNLDQLQRDLKVSTPQTGKSSY